jgi:hypothetical protein
MASNDDGFDGSRLAELANRFRNASSTPIARKTKGATIAERLALEDQAIGKIDRRTLRKTGRTEQLNLRCSATTRERIKAICEDTGWSASEMLEHALTALEAARAAATSPRV